MDNKTFLLISFILSLSLLILGVVFSAFISKRNVKNRTFVKSFWVLATGVFLSAVVMFYPTYYLNYFAGAEGEFELFFKSLALSVHNSMRLFVLDGEFDALRDLVITVGAGKGLSFLYSVYGAFMFVLGPTITAGVVLTFIKNARAYILYYLNVKKDMYYFTCLNEKSLILATDVYKTYGKKALIVFLNVDFDNANEDLLQGATNINAVCFSGKEITELSLKPNLKNAVRKLYFINENQTKNVENALILIEKCRKLPTFNHKNTQFYVFSVSNESTILLDNADNSDMKVRRVDESRNLMYDVIRDYSIFESAIEENGVKKINALILGCGKHGAELAKALCWYSQMYGYELKLSVVDKRTDVLSKFASACPEIIKFNGQRIDGDAFYNVDFYEGVDVEGVEFRNIISKLGNITVSYAMLGDDDLNINASIIIREELGRNVEGEFKSKIFALVESPEKNKTIFNNGGLKNYAGISYGITLIGDIDNQYSLDVIEQQELEEKGLKCHLRWSQTGEDIINDTKKFDNYEYFRRASIAEALYSEMRIKLGLLLSGNDNEEILKEYEHRRWNAYMRTEGYVYGKNKDTVSKTHPSLIPYVRLSTKEKNKDKVVLQASEE